MLKLYNTLNRKRIIHSYSPKRVRMYTCGPTVYDRAHYRQSQRLLIC